MSHSPLRLVLTAGVAMLLGGCSAASAGTAALLATPRVLSALRGSNTIESSGRGRTILDDRRTWARVIVDDSGHPLSPGESPARAMHLVWEIPLRVGRDVQAVAGLGEVACAYDPNVPVHWELWGKDEEGNPRRVGEAWRASYVSANSQGSYVLDPLQAEALAMQMRVNGLWRLTWLMIVPGAGDYVLKILWPVSNDGLQGKPCVEAWGALDRGIALSATAPSRQSGAPGWARPLTPHHTTSQEPRIPRNPAPLSVAFPEEPSNLDEPDGYITARFGLLSVPAYDITRLHQAALENEFASAFDAQTSAALVAYRARTLETGLRTDPEGLCRAVRSHSLDGRELRLWGGEPTVPPSIVQAVCSS